MATTLLSSAANVAQMSRMLDGCGTSYFSDSTVKFCVVNVRVHLRNARRQGISDDAIRAKSSHERIIPKGSHAYQEDKVMLVDVLSKVHLLDPRQQGTQH